MRTRYQLHHSLISSPPRLPPPDKQCVRGCLIGEPVEFELLICSENWFKEY